MKEQNEFDELARRKLEEREFPFQPSHWQEMEQVLDAQKKQRRWGGWWLLPLLLLIGGGGYMIYDTTSASSEELAQANDATIPTTPDPEQQQAAPAVDPKKDVAPTTENELTENEAEGTEANESIAVDLDAAEPTDPSPSQVNTASTDPPQNAGVHRTAGAVDVRSTSTERSVRPPSPEAPARTGTDRVDGQEQTGAVEVAVAEARDTVMDNAADEADTSATDGSEYAGTEAAANDRPTVTEPADVATTTTGEVAATAEETPQKGNDVTSSAVAEDEVENTVPSKDALPPGPDAIAGEDAASGTPVDDEAATGTNDLVVQDTISVDVESLIAPVVPTAPLVDSRSPLELNIHAGAMMTNSSYGGPTAVEWNSTIGQEPAYTFGAELMRMGRNFGIGGGIHYSTYAERITTDEMTRTETTDRHFYFLSPVDTTLLIITDTVNGEYIGTSVYTTVMVLDEGTETITTTARLREARDQINRTSYLEIPLLLDAHVVQGRWSLGLRGGPTLGILSQRNGSLPNSSFDGYQDLEDQEFRSLVIGYTARAYIRHRFNAAWSVGVEPMLRGHLMNGLEGDRLTRRPAGWGGILSLNYRFR